MTVRVGINGFGRIGRNFFRAVQAPGADIEIVAVNDLDRQRDAGPPAEVRLDPGPPRRRRHARRGRHHASATGRSRSFAERDPAAPAVGRPRRRRRRRVHRLLHRRRPRPRAHVDAGAKKVIISAPATTRTSPSCSASTTTTYDAAQHTRHLQRLLHHELPRPDGQGAARRRSASSKGLMTTIHAYTADQNCQDDPTRTCAGPAPPRINIVPTSTGAAKAIGLVLPSSRASSTATPSASRSRPARSPTSPSRLSRETTVDEVNAAVKAAAEGRSGHPEVHRPTRSSPPTSSPTRRRASSTRR